VSGGAQPPGCNTPHAATLNPIGRPDGNERPRHAYTRTVSMTALTSTQARPSPGERDWPYRSRVQERDGESRSTSGVLIPVPQTPGPPFPR
jgi:hypothetical protein